jgi:hypothetical protein
MSGRCNEWSSIGLEIRLEQDGNEAQGTLIWQHRKYGCPRSIVCDSKRTYQSENGAHVGTTT